MKWKLFLGATAAFFLLITGFWFTAHRNGTKPVAANLQTRPGEISSKSDQTADSAKTLRVQESYGKLPLYFIENQGQTDDAVKFLEKGHGHSTFFTQDEVVFAFHKTKKDDKEASASVMKLTPLGMNKNVQVIPEDRQQGTVNYFIGNDPAKWRTNIPTYTALVYKEAYPGIDIKFYGNNRQIEYDIIIKPGADPSQLSFRYGGVAGAVVNPAGDLVITLADGGELIQKKPLIYQETDGKILPLEGGFVIETTKCASALMNLDVERDKASHGEITQQQGSGEFACGFKIASYDRSQKLIIDPVLIYSTYLGGSGSLINGLNAGDVASGIAIDASGCAYVTGTTASLDFPTQNALFPNIRGPSNAFVTKFNASGTALIYSTYLGGSGSLINGSNSGDQAFGIAIDASGCAYVTGSTTSPDFPTQNALFPNIRGPSNAFVTKFNASGTALIYSTYLGGSGCSGTNCIPHLHGDGARAIAVDALGCAYVTGWTDSPDFPTRNALFPNFLNIKGGGNAFVTKFNASGTSLIYSTYLGGSGFLGGSGGGEVANAIAVDASGCAYVTGDTSSSDFPTQNALFPSLPMWNGSAFVTKFNPSGTALIYSTYLGGKSSCNELGTDAISIAVDTSGCAYLAGRTWTSDFPTQNALFPGPVSCFYNDFVTEHGFVTKFNQSGTAFIYSTYLGGSYRDEAIAIAADASGCAYVTGWASSSDFPMQNPLFPNLLSANGSAFVTKFNPSGTALIYSTYLGGSGGNRVNGTAAYAIAVDAHGGAYVAGGTGTSDFPTQNPIFPNLRSRWNAFVSKISDGIPPAFQYGQSPNSGHASEPVNTALGNYTYEHTDLKLAGNPGIEFKRAYNSQDGYQGPLGYGWTHSYNIFVSAQDSQTVIVKYADGHEEQYIANSDGTFTPAHGGIYSTLLKNQDETYTVKDKTQKVYSFGTNGKLLSIVDKNGNSISLYYLGGILKNVSDLGGRTLSFIYDSNKRIGNILDPMGRYTYYTYDANGNLASYTDASGGIWAYQYDAAHHITSIVNPRGKTLVSNAYSGSQVVSQTNGRGYTTTFQYNRPTSTPNVSYTTITGLLGNRTIHIHNENYQLTNEINSLWNSISYTYDTNGNRTNVTDKRGNSAQYTYDVVGNVTSKTDAIGNITSITYDANNNPSTRVDALGNTTRFGYDAYGNLTSTTDPLGKVTSRTYDASGNVLSITDANGNTTSFSYDAYGNPTQAKDPLGNTKTTTHDIAGRKLSETDANGNVTSYAYDANDNLLSITDALGHVQSFTYDANNNKISATDRNALTTYYAYDENDNLVSTTDALGGLTSYTYDALDRKTAITDARGNVTSNTIDLVGNVTGIKDGEGRISSFTYDANGNRLSATDSLGHVTSYIYDALNRLTSTIDPLGNVQAKAYDAIGRVMSETDANGNLTQYQYDALGCLLQVTEAGGQISSFTYDPVGNRTALTNARGKTTSYIYDGSNRLIEEINPDPDANVMHYGYDRAGNLTSQQKPDSAVINYSYDTLNRLSGIAYPTGSLTTFAYDAVGNRTGMTDTLGTSSWVFDALNRTVAYTDPFGKLVQYVYDATGNRTEMSYPGSLAVIYAYDKTGRMLSVSDWLGNTTSYQYDGAGTLISASNPNGSTANYSYDASSRLTSLVNSKADQSIINGYSYTLDAVGNQVAENRNEPLLTTLPAASFASTFDNDDRIQNAGSQTFTHDANGNRIAQTGPNAATFIYDYANRLTSVSGATTYGYDGLGNRMTRTDSAVETRFVLDVAGKLPNVIAETDAGGNAISYYVYGLGLVSQITPDGKSYTYHYDSRGSTIAISDASGKIVNKYAYTPFGELAGASESITNPFCYVGKHGIMEEGNGLKLMRARYYDAETGRFLNKDLVQGDLRKPQGLNRYVYALNNPVRMVDMRGLSASESTMWNNIYGSSDNNNNLQLNSDNTSSGLWSDIKYLMNTPISQLPPDVQNSIPIKALVNLNNFFKSAAPYTPKASIGGSVTGGSLFLDYSRGYDLQFAPGDVYTKGSGASIEQTDSQSINIRAPNRVDVGGSIDFSITLLPQYANGKTYNVSIGNWTVGVGSGATLDISYGKNSNPSPSFGMQETQSTSILNF